MRDNKGFTLIELVVSIAILSSVIMVIASFYISGVRGFARESTTTSNQVKVRRASNDIGREIRRASSVENVPNVLNLKYPNGNKIIYYLEASTSTIRAKHYELSPTGNYVDVYTSNIVDGIKNFNINISGDDINIEIESIENTENETYKLKTEITLRR